MYEYYSIGDGFVEITESLGDLITYVANEPSVGLYYIQQHAKEATENTTSLRNTVSERSHETSLQTDDLEDSITGVSGIKECGLRITDEMIGDIERSLSMVLAKQQTGWSWMPTVLSQSAGHLPNERVGGYLSMVFSSSKGKTGNFKRRGANLDITQETKEDCPSFPVSASGSRFSMTEPENQETDELPLSIQAADEDETQVCGLNGVARTHYTLSTSENYQLFEPDRKARLGEWLIDNKPPDSIGSI